MKLPGRPLPDLSPGRKDDVVRALFVIAGLPAGGAERQLSVLLPRLNPRRVAPVLLIFNAVNKIHYRDVLAPSITLRSLGLEGASPSRLLWPLVKGVAQVVRDVAPNIVCTSLNVANHVTRLSQLLFRWRAPIITSVRNDFRLGYTAQEKLAERLLWRRSARILCNSRATGDQLMADLHVPAERVEVVPNGIDPKFFSRELRPSPDWWPNSRVALVLGRFSPQKNHLGLVRSLARLERENLLEEWRVVLVGEGPLEDEIRTAIEAASLRHRVMLQSPVGDPCSMYQRAEIVVLPSLYEGLPNVALEAQAMGCPVAITVRANASGAVLPQHGFILDDDLMAGLTRAFNATTEYLADRGRAARARMQEEYSVMAMVKHTEDVLLRVAGCGG